MPHLKAALIIVTLMVAAKLAGFTSSKWSDVVVFCGAVVIGFFVVAVVDRRRR